MQGLNLQNTKRGPTLLDLHPPKGDFRQDVLTGLREDVKRIPSMYFYDQRGSKLFDEICKLEEYYPTRTEIEILETQRENIAKQLAQRCMLIELGSGSSEKTHVLLKALVEPDCYVPVDISKEHLLDAAKRVQGAFPGLPVLPVCADFMSSELRLPEGRTPRKKVVFFPGSTIGNFAQPQRMQLLATVARLCRPEGGGLLIGIDLKKSRARLESAYNDQSGVTAEFNLNLLRRINHELGANFQISKFKHNAFYNAEQGRIEMHLVSQTKQAVTIGDESFYFTEGETICTEYSYKFDVAEFARDAGKCGYHLTANWQDPHGLFALLYLELTSDANCEA